MPTENKGTMPKGAAPAKKNIKTDGLARMNFICSEDLRARVKARCAEERISMTDVIIEFLEKRFPKR